MMFDSTIDRVPAHTPRAIQQKITKTSKAQLKNAIRAGKPACQKKLAKLAHEWDTERVLETNATLLILTGLLLGKKVHQNWYWLSGAVAAFLLEHALQGWCPPLPIIRALGVRTAAEIDASRAALTHYLKTGDKKSTLSLWKALNN